jgi:catechol 2,3-dioxygenase-like lactoylglutathione lyase family enzyme
MSAVVPFFRVKDAETSARWYARLGFEVVWQHRFAPGAPLLLTIRLGAASIFLSEHGGDAPRKSLAYVYVDDVQALAEKVRATPARTPYGMLEIELTDPDGNRLRIGTPTTGA